MNRSIYLSVFAALSIFSGVGLAADAPATQPATQPAADLPHIRFERMFKLERPVWGGHDPLGRMFFIEQEGRVRLYENGQIAEKPYLTVKRKLVKGSELGLLSIAFHPDFAKNGYFYADYDAKEPNIKTYIVEYHVDPAAKEVDPNSERVIMTINQPYENHKGGQLAFGPDGYLYIGMGDGGNQKDPHRNGQNPGMLLGKILRIDVAPREGYGIPKDNPFATKTNWAPEVYAIGFRNPWRFSFDPVTGLLYAGDVGQDTWEEVDIVQKGGNYGWSVREGLHDYQTLTPMPRTIDPIFEYNHNRTAASVTGGFVYRGKKIPELVGWYIFGEYSQGVIYGLKYEDGKVTSSGMLVNPKDPTRLGGLKSSQPSAFADDADGELYMCDNTSGFVYKIVSEK